MKRLQGHEFDTLVIGGGIFGAGAAREAALNGWRTALVDGSDFGSATSQSSSKLLHGGLRYLAQGRLGLVREALQERELLQEIAPQLSKPLPFLVPVHHHRGIGAWKLRCGLFLYDFLAGVPRHRRRDWLSAQEATMRDSAISPTELKGAGLYWDTLTDDAALVLSSILSAEKNGAAVRNYTKVVSIERINSGFTVELLDTLNGKTARLSTRTIINASGPWTDEIRRLLLPDTKNRATFSKGVHIVVPQRSSSNALFLSAGDDGRVFFVIPFHGRSLVGTTDSPHNGPPEAVRVEQSDIEYLIKAAGATLSQPIEPEAVISSFAGLRTLAGGSGALSSISREEVIWEEPEGVIHVIGGKLTTFRRIARRLLERASRSAHLKLDRGELSRSTPFPDQGIGINDLHAEVALTQEDYRHVVENLHVRTASDLARRRLPLLLIRSLSPSERTNIARGLGDQLGWSPEEVASQARSLENTHE